MSSGMLMAIFTVSLLYVYYRRKASVRTTGSTTTVNGRLDAVYLQHARVGIIDHRPYRFFHDPCLFFGVLSVRLHDAAWP